MTQRTSLKYARAWWRIVLMLVTLSLAACGLIDDDADDEAERPERATIITAQEAQQRTVEVTERAIGRVRAKTAPLVSAEVSGRVMELLVDEGEAVTEGQLLAEVDAEEHRIAERRARAEVQRLQALIANQERIVERFRGLVEERFVTETELDQAESQLAALQEQLEGAQAEVEETQRSIRRSKLHAPVAGRIDERMVDRGDFVSAGSPLFRIATEDMLRVHLPFPERLAARLERGQDVRLTTPTVPGNNIDGYITEIRPMIGLEAHTVNVVVELENPGQWKPGASANATVILERRDDAVLVPLNSIVRRPAGRVVYVIGDDDRAEQRVVETGVRQDGYQEILSGVEAGERVAVDGASFLTDGAKVTVQESR